jgi:hypothetical protein
MQSPDKLGEALNALSNPYRRQLLLALRNHNPQDADDTDPLNVAADRPEDVEALQTELFHVHLPKLAEMGFIEWDQETNEISKGPRWDEIAPLLRLISNHRDELPKDWL